MSLAIYFQLARDTQVIVRLPIQGRKLFIQKGQSLFCQQLGAILLEILLACVEIKVCVHVNGQGSRKMEPSGLKEPEACKKKIMSLSFLIEVNNMQNKHSSEGLSSIFVLPFTSSSFPLMITLVTDGHSNSLSYQNVSAPWPFICSLFLRLS